MATFLIVCVDLLGGAQGAHAVALGLAGSARSSPWSPRPATTSSPSTSTTVSDLHRIGGTIGFILIALVWFYAISLALLAGAVINSLRHERDDTGALPLDG